MSKVTVDPNKPVDRHLTPGVYNHTPLQIGDSNDFNDGTDVELDNVNTQSDREDNYHMDEDMMSSHSQDDMMQTMRRDKEVISSSPIGGFKVNGFSFIVGFKPEKHQKCSFKAYETDGELLQLLTTRTAFYYGNMSYDSKTLLFTFFIIVLHCGCSPGA